MTIDKAIKFLEEYQREHYYGFNVDFVDALKLGIEALKRIQNRRNPNIDIIVTLLPGETQ